MERIFNLLIQMYTTAKDGDQKCNVCNKKFKKYDICRKLDIYDCEHLFHASCICKLTNCPVCNHKIVEKLASLD